MLTTQILHNSTIASKNPVESVIIKERECKKKYKKDLEEIRKNRIELTHNLINEIIKDICKHTKTARKIISKLLTFFKRYDVVNPSQSFMGKMVGAERETVNKLLKFLHKLGYINKKDNGWAICDKKPKGTFRKNKLTYKMGPKIKLLLKLINTQTRRYTKEIELMLALIPSLGLYIVQNVTDTNSKFKYKEVSITSKKNSFEETPTNSQETSFFLKRGNCEISSPYMPTSIVSNECYEEYENPVFKKWVRHVQWKAREEKIARKRREVRRNRRDKIKTNSQTERGDKNYIFAKNAIIAKENGEDKGTSLRQGFKLTQRLKEILEYGK